MSDYGGPGRSHNPPEQPVRSATRAAEIIAATAKVAGPEGAVAGEALDVAVKHKNREPNRSLRQEAGKQAKKRAVSTGFKIGGRFTSQHLLIAEFLVCFIVLGLSPLSKDVKAGDWMKKSSAVCLLFLILALIASAGSKSRQAATGLGALVTVGLLLDQRSVFSLMINKFSGTSAQQNAAVAAGAKSLAAGGAPQIIRTPQGPQTVTLVPGPNGDWTAGNSVDF